MKKNLISFLCLLTLVGCNGGSTSSLSSSQSTISSSSSEVITSSSSSKTSSESSSSIERVNAKEVIQKLIDNPISVNGNYREYQVMGKQEYESTSFSSTSVLTEKYFYNEIVDKDGVSSKERIDKADDGRAKIITLDPRTNTVIDNFLGDEIYGYYAFSDFFTNPFILAKNSFTVSKNKVTLVNFANMNVVFLTNLFTGGSGFLNATNFKSMAIGFDSNHNPTTIEIVMEEKMVGSIGQGKVCEYKGTFTELDESVVSPLPVPREAQDGQDTLGNMFTELKKGNYTVNVTIEQKDGDASKTKKAASYITQDGYYNVYTSGFDGKASDGKYMTNEGLVDFVVTEDNKIKETKKPYTIRTVDYYLGYAWNFAKESFDVNSDGSFTLASEPTFYNYVWSDLIPDINFAPVGYIDEGSLNFVVNTTNNTMTYTYTCLEGKEAYTTEITDIGNTTFSLNKEDVIKYEEYTNWTDYCATSSWHNELASALDGLTGGSINDVPYIESPYKYQRAYQGVFDYNWDVEPAQIIMVFVKKLTLTWELDTQEELDSQTSVIFDQLDNNSKYTYNEEEDTYYYKNGDAEFTLTFKSEANFVGIDSIYNYAIILELTNLKDYVPE